MFRIKSFVLHREKPQHLSQLTSFSWKTVIDIDPHLLQFVPASLQTVSLCRRAIEKDPTSLKHVVDQNNVLGMSIFGLFLMSLFQHWPDHADPNSFRHQIIVFFFCIVMIALQKDPLCIQWVRQPTDKMWEYAVERNGLVLQHFTLSNVKRPNTEALKPHDYKHAADPTEHLDPKTWEMALYVLAVARTPQAIQFVYPRAFQFRKNLDFLPKTSG